MRHYSNSPNRSNAPSPMPGSSGLLGLFSPVHRATSYNLLSDTTHTLNLATRSPHSVVLRSPNTAYGILTCSNGKWGIKLEDNRYQVPFSGPYDYVTMPNGEIRVKLSTIDQLPSHSPIAEDVDHVISAGQLGFSDDGELIWWDTHSVDYPSSAPNINVGLPLEAYDNSEATAGNRLSFD